MYFELPDTDRTKEYYRQISSAFFSDTVYSERYMGFPTPSENLKGYQVSSIIFIIYYIFLLLKSFLIQSSTFIDCCLSFESYVSIYSQQTGN